MGETNPSVFQLPDEMLVEILTERLQVLNDDNAFNIAMHKAVTMLLFTFFPFSLWGIWKALKDDQVVLQQLSKLLS